MAGRDTQQPRTRCRLPCTVKRGRRRVRARVLDVSEGGLCVMSPVRLPMRQTLEVIIDDPRGGPVEIEAVVWHDRPFVQPSSGRKGFATGMVLSKGGLDFRALASPGASQETAAQAALESLQSEPRSPQPSPAPPPKASPPLESTPPPASPPELLEIEDGPSLFRVRVKAVGAPRIRTLTLAATSESAVREAVLSDLEGDWEVLDVEVDPLET